MRKQHLRPLVRATAFAVALAALAPAPPAAADSAAREFGRGAVVGLAYLLYVPVKLIYATGGALVAGIAFAFSGGDSDVAGPIVDASLRGDYVVTPAHLDRRERLEFIGRPPRQHQAAEEARGWDAAAPPPEVQEEGF